MVYQHEAEMSQTDGRQASFDEVVNFLMAPQTYGRSDEVEVVHTHAAMVFLTGPDAYKIKRPVRYDYLDFSTLEKRQTMLCRELELNSPAAPEIYLDLVAVTRGDDGQLTLGGKGDIVEWCLHMRRFPADALLAEIAERGQFTRGIAEDTGKAIADYHSQAIIRDEDGAALIADITKELTSTLSGMSAMFDDVRIRRFETLVTEAVNTNAPLLTKRGRAGHVRRGHGDLHLDNMVLLDNRPVPFDALEFDERLGTLDVLYDLSFVLMDLLHRGLAEAANAVLGAYLYRARQPDHLDALSLLPMFLGLRAGIRAMVSAQAARIAPELAASKSAAANAYLDHALDYLAPSPPRLVVVGGNSGTGKTSLARRLAPGIGTAPGALHLRSDLERKALFGVDPLSRLPEHAYSEDITRHVYARLLDQADRILKAGHSVVLDAVYAEPEERSGVAELAQRNGVALSALWLEGEAASLVARVSARRGDASDADESVVRTQIARGGGAPEGWWRVDASGTISATLEQALAAIEADGIIDVAND